MEILYITYVCLQNAVCFMEHCSRHENHFKIVNAKFSLMWSLNRIRVGRDVSFSFEELMILGKRNSGMTKSSIVIATQFSPSTLHVRRKYHVFLYLKIPVYLPTYANSFVTSARVKRERERERERERDSSSPFYFIIFAHCNGTRYPTAAQIPPRIVLSQGTKRRRASIDV